MGWLMESRSRSQATSGDAAFSLAETVGLSIPLMRRGGQASWIACVSRQGGPGEICVLKIQDWSGQQGWRCWRRHDGTGRSEDASSKHGWFQAEVLETATFLSLAV